MFNHDASDEVLYRFIRCMFRAHQMFAGDLWGNFRLFIGCFLSVLGISLRVIEDFFRVGWFVLVFIWRFLKSWLRFDVN